MIKTDYLGYKLRELSVQRDTWRAFYYGDSDYAMGVGHSPEAAVAMAQKEIKEKVNAK